MCAQAETERFGLLFAPPRHSYIKYKRKEEHALNEVQC